MANQTPQDHKTWADWIIQFATPTLAAILAYLAQRAGWFRQRKIDDQEAGGRLYSAQADVIKSGLERQGELDDAKDKMLANKERDLDMLRKDLDIAENALELCRAKNWEHLELIGDLKGKIFVMEREIVWLKGLKDQRQ